MDRREQRFWKKVSREDANGCRVWANELSDKGYGQVTYNGWRTTAHRVAYTLVHGPIPEGMVVMHKCDNRACCNPAHLQVGTQAENLADMRAKGRAGDTRLYGERHGRCKVSSKQVDEIRKMYAGTRLSQQAIADQFGISQSQVGRIVNGGNRVMG